MQSLFEQSKKKMKQVNDQWREILEDESDIPFTGGEQVKENLRIWLTAARSNHESVQDMWNKLSDQGQAAFFRIFSDSSFANEAAEKRMRAALESITRARHTWYKMIETNLIILEDSLKKTPDSQ